MSVLNEALEFLGLTGDFAPPDRYELRIARTRKEQRELAASMRRLPGRFAGRLPVRAVEQVHASAAAGQWEQSIDELITALRTNDVTVTGAERAELRAVLGALDMSARRIDCLCGTDVPSGPALEARNILGRITRPGEAGDAVG